MRMFTPFSFQACSSAALVCDVACDVKMPILEKEDFAAWSSWVMKRPIVPVAPKMRMFWGRGMFFFVRDVVMSFGFHGGFICRLSHLLLSIGGNWSVCQRACGACRTSAGY